jgi:predicted nucleic acid-binding protein
MFQRPRGGDPRRRQIDLAIVATAIVERVPLLTHDLADFEILKDMVQLGSRDGLRGRRP